MNHFDPLPMRDRAPAPTFPSGWYCVAESADVPLGVLHPITFLGRQLIVYRTEDGVARAADAFCPHLGAHLASHDGRLSGDRITCPFHRWQWDAITGKCAAIPYCSTLPRATLPMFTTREVDDMVLVWHHPQGQQPDREPFIAGFPDDPTLVPFDTREWVTTSPFRDILENFFDTGHVVSLHGYTPPTVLAFERTPYGLRFELGLNYSLIPDGPQARMLCHFSGVTLLAQHFELGPTRFAVLHSFTPIDLERFRHRTRLFLTDLGSTELTGHVGRQIADRFFFDVEQDLKVLAYKKHLVRPALCAGDGPIMRFREYQDAFYS